MKKILTSFDKTIDCINVYRDDIEQIYEILSHVSPNPQIEVNDYIIEDISEIEKLSKVEIPRYIKIKVPEIEVRINKSNAWVYSSSHEDSVEGYLFRIVQILENRKKKVVPLIDKWSMIIAFFSSMVGLGLLRLNSANTTINLLGVILMAIALFSFFTGITIFISKATDTKISLMYKKDQPNFFQRNKDDLIIGFTMLVLGILIGKIM
jgi:hypothetical protein